MSIKEFVNKHRHEIIGAGATIAAAAPTMAFAEGETNAATSAITTMAGDVATEGVGMIGAVLPQLTPLLAAGLLVGLGIAFVKKITNRSK